jgi:citrate lyase subunit beta / citryl-CoA lyase
MMRYLKDNPIMRSLLFVPGHKEDMAQKAAKSDADLIVLDLEDAVPVNAKESARKTVKDIISIDLFKNKPLLVRINPSSSGLLEDDLADVACKEIQGFVYPMATEVEILAFDKKLHEIEEELDLPAGYYSVIPLIETPSSILNALNICKASDRNIGILFGSEDFLARTKGKHSDDEIALDVARSLVVIAARASGLEPLDAPYVKVHDLDGLERFAKRGSDIGMAGMLVLSPRQLPLVHDIYTPSIQEIELAANIVRNSENINKNDEGIAVIDGDFISPPTLKMAINILEKAQKIKDAGKVVKNAEEWIEGIN